jgi:hypothetical protein
LTDRRLYLKFAGSDRRPELPSPDTIQLTPAYQTVKGLGMVDLRM